jgi:hypothetical protein
MGFERLHRGLELAAHAGVKLAQLTALMLLLPAAAGIASANAPKRAPRLTIVKIMPDAGQALIHDRNRGDYVVVRQGDAVGELVVSEVEDDQVVLTASGEPPVHYVLPLIQWPEPPTSQDARAAGAPGPATPMWGWGTTAKPAPVAPTPSAPASAPTAAPATDVIDPYEIDDAAEFDEASEPIHAADAAAVTAPMQAPSATTQPPKATAPTAPTAPVAASTTPAVVSRTIARDEFDRAMSDFHARSKEIAVRVEDRGVRVVKLAAGSFFERLGLKKGDLVLTVAGRGVLSADEAAIVYVELSRASEFDVSLERAGATMTIRYRFLD